MAKAIRIDATTAVPEHEVWFEFAHSPGPGGQHANKASTQAALCFAPARSGNLAPAQKRRILTRLRNRISKDGVLRVVARDARSQAENRRLAEERFAELLRDALRVPRKRRPTRPTRGSRERRLEEKRIRAETKRLRRRPPPPET